MLRVHERARVWRVPTPGSPAPQTPDEGAWTSVFAAVSPDLEGVGGRYLYNERDTRSLGVTYDTRLQRRLWDISCRLTGLRDDSTEDPD